MTRSSFSPFLWPLCATALATRNAADSLDRYLRSQLSSDPDDAPAKEPAWATPNTVVLDLPTMRLRDFSNQSRGRATLICAPYALHGATIADFAPGHSIVEVMRNNGLPRVHVTEWKSATPEMKYYEIDHYLADLNVAVDELGGPVDLVGLCQGAWMALVYAARFPDKVGRLVLAAGPIDIDAGSSALSRLTADSPLSAFEGMVRLGSGRVLGEQVLDLWEPVLSADDVEGALQLSSTDGPRIQELKARFEEWYKWTVNLPGTYFLQVVHWLFRENRIASGRFVALGRVVNLSGVRVPLFMLAARDDELIDSAQLFAAGKLIGSPERDIVTAVEPCNHLALFLGKRSLAGSWQRIAKWLGGGTRPPAASRTSAETIPA